MDDYAGTQAGLTDRPRPESPQLPRQEKIFLPGEDANIRRILRKCCTCWTQHHFPTIKISMSTPIGNFQIYQLKCDTGFMRCFAMFCMLSITSSDRDDAKHGKNRVSHFNKIWKKDLNWLHLWSERLISMQMKFARGDLWKSLLLDCQRGSVKLKKS